MTSYFLIDSRVEDYKDIADALPADSLWALLDPALDGLEQMTALLAGVSGLESIQIISHGSPGTVYLGNAELNENTIGGYATQLKSIGQALAPNGDILLYGCDVGAGATGRHFMKTLVMATGADVAASENSTGQNGGWELEVAVGTVEASGVAVDNYAHQLGDTLAPTLTSLSIPTSVDLSAGNAGLTISGTANDDISGVSKVIVWFDKSFSYASTTNSTSFSTYSFLGNYGIWDPWSDGSSSQTYNISSINTSGTYNVSKVTVEDVQGNVRTYASTDLAAMGVNTAVNFTGATADTLAPTLTSLSIPTSVDLSAGNAGLTISGTANDDISGVSKVIVWFDKSFSYASTTNSTSFSTYSFLGNYGIWDPWSDGSSSQTYNISSINTSGTYNVSKVTVEDVQGNVRTYASTDLAVMGVNTSVLFKDSAYTPAAISISESISNGQVTLSLSATHWSADTNSINLTLSYDPSVAHWSDAIAGSAGNYATIISATESSQNGTVTLQASINNFGDSTDFLLLNFSFNNTVASEFSYSITGITLNGESLASISDSVPLISDKIVNAGGSAGNDIYTGNSSFNDTIDYSAAIQPVNVNLATGVATGHDIGSDTVTNFENIIGGKAGDKLIGDASPNGIKGNDGNDVIDGGMGADHLVGGNGNDLYVIDHPNDRITELSSGGDHDSVSAKVSYTLPDNVENLFLTGTAKISTAGAFTQKYTPIDLGLDGIGNSQDNILQGNRGDNKLNGMEGNDVLLGGAGSDILIGAAGCDKLMGGTGHDIFVLTADDLGLDVFKADIIMDFEDGVDRIALPGGIKFTDLTIAQGNGIDTPTTSTVISAGGAEYLTLLLNTAPYQLNAGDFITAG